MIPEASRGGADYSRDGDSWSSCVNSDDLGGGSGGTLKNKTTRRNKVNEISDKCEVCTKRLGSENCSKKHQRRKMAPNIGLLECVINDGCI